MKVRNFPEKKPGPIKLFGRLGSNDLPNQDKSAHEDAKTASEEAEDAPKDVKASVIHKKHETDSMEAADEVIADAAVEDKSEITDKGRNRLSAVMGTISNAFGNTVRFMLSLSPKMLLTVTLIFSGVTSFSSTVKVSS